MVGGRDWEGGMRVYGCSKRRKEEALDAYCVDYGRKVWDWASWAFDVVFCVGDAWFGTCILAVLLESRRSFSLMHSVDAYRPKRYPSLTRLILNATKLTLCVECFH